MDEYPPDAPPLSGEAVESVVDWLDEHAAWLRHDHEMGRAHGHRISLEALANLRLYEDAALLCREAYGLPLLDHE